MGMGPSDDLLVPTKWRNLLTRSAPYSQSLWIHNEKKKSLRFRRRSGIVRYIFLVSKHLHKRTPYIKIMAYKEFYDL